MTPKPFSLLAESLIADLRGIPPPKHPKMKRRPTLELAAVIEGLLVKFEIGRSSAEQTIRHRWPEIVGEANAAYSSPICLDARRRLVVVATHSVVRNELFLHREAIVERIQKIPGCSDIRHIHVRPG